MKTITDFFAPKSKRQALANNEEQSEINKRPKVLSFPNDTVELLSGVPKPLEVFPTASATKSFFDLFEHLYEPSWKEVLATKRYASLAAFLHKERSSNKIYPSPEDTFTALNSTSRHNIRVVIVGQDPYHQPGQAHGLSFSVRKGVPPPPSLVNIYKELIQDPGVPNFTTMPSHGYLLRWAEQGVLLLNTVMTVRRGDPNSHKNKGWEDVTDAILRACPEKVVFLLWGKPAQAKAERFTKAGSIVISTSHPSPLGAAKTNSPFLKSCCFSRCNDALITMGFDPIDWNVDGPLPKRTDA
ncbi:uracil-DNA glycosylase [Fistulifera solaris]|uniref:Uracil-DNA glycosylase n=1 Tax=Fistulifera solaris TaxID=1519565 RepID=A0A1Z5K7C1_FISSO|nr:uracil-DNA glycosylase [Fistulifera solaris]|eukprot:GAX22137.1 uracil-DNA glycosylase [Fistulifera solaris]